MNNTQTTASNRQSSEKGTKKNNSNDICPICKQKKENYEDWMINNLAKPFIIAMFGAIIGIYSFNKLSNKQCDKRSSKSSQNAGYNITK